MMNGETLWIWHNKVYQLPVTMVNIITVQLLCKSNNNNEAEETFFESTWHILVAFLCIIKTQLNSVGNRRQQLGGSSSPSNFRRAAVVAYGLLNAAKFASSQGCYFFNHHFRGSLAFGGASVNSSSCVREFPMISPPSLLLHRFSLFFFPRRSTRFDQHATQPHQHSRPNGRDSRHSSTPSAYSPCCTWTWLEASCSACNMPRRYSAISGSSFFSSWYQSLEKWSMIAFLFSCASLAKLHISKFLFFRLMRQNILHYSKLF